MPDAPPTALANRACARALIDAFVASGVRHAVLCPGSRSTPLAMAAHEHPDLDLTVHFDERGAAFFALGIGRATGVPAVWITTSGTAVANGMPAAVEAHADDVPLLLVTADRPPELRRTGANQTIDQPGFFDRVARWSLDLPVPRPTLDARAWATAGAQAAFRAQHPHAGPVHLNAPFAKPLWPDPDAPPPDAPPTAPRHAFALAEAPLGDLPEALAECTCGLIVAGRLRSAREADAARALADRLGWPLVADVCSQARLGAGLPAAHHDLALASDAWLDAHLPDAVVLAGAMPVSMRLLRLLERARPAVWASVRSGPDRVDPHHRATHVLTGSVAATLGALAAACAPQAPGRWAADWHAAADAAWRAVEPLVGSETLSEPALAYRLSRLLPPGEALVAAASMPIRDVQTFGAADGARACVYANRGASGIDGTVATAAGVARATARGATLLIGDLALLHDLNSLALLRALPERVVVVCVNNDGGGIFGALPVAAYGAATGSDPFERLFGTPHGTGFADAARQFELAYAAPTTAPAFERAYAAALARRGSTLIEVATDRRDGVRDHLIAAAARAASALIMG